MIRADGVRL